MTARRPGCRPGPGTTKRLSACGTSAVSFWESSRSRPGGRGTVVSGRVHTMRNGDQGEGLPCRLVLAGCCSEPWPAVILPALLEIFAHQHSHEASSWHKMVTPTEHSSPRLTETLGPREWGRCQAGHENGRRTWETGSVSSPRPGMPVTTLS